MKGNMAAGKLVSSKLSEGAPSLQLAQMEIHSLALGDSPSLEMQTLELLPTPASESACNQDLEWFPPIWKFKGFDLK